MNLGTLCFEPPPPLAPQKKKREAPSLHDTASHWLHGNSIPKIGYHYFRPELIALPKNTLLIFFYFRLICWGASQVQLFFFCCNEHIWLGHCKEKKLNLWRLLIIEDLKECVSLWPTYIGEEGRTLGKTYGIKTTCYWEHPWGTHWKPREHIKNLMGTHWKLERNMLGTKEKWKKSYPSPHPRKLKRK